MVTAAVGMVTAAAVVHCSRMTCLSVINMALIFLMKDLLSGKD